MVVVKVSWCGVCSFGVLLSNWLSGLPVVLLCWVGAFECCIAVAATMRPFVIWWFERVGVAIARGGCGACCSWGGVCVLGVLVPSH